MEQRPKLTNVAAYFYGEQTVCPACIKDIVVPFYRIADSERSTEDILNEAAAFVSIDRSNEATFNSREFPKVIADSEIIHGDDYCYVCLRQL